MIPFLTKSQDFAQSLEEVERLKKELENATDSMKVADLCFTIYADYTFGIRSETKDTPDYLFRALRIYETTSEYKKLGDVHNALGGYYYNRQLFTKAQEQWTKSGAYYQKGEYIEGVAKSYNNLSQAYADEDTLKIYYIRKSIHLSVQIADSVILGTGYNNLSKYYQVQGDYGKAEEYLTQSIKLSEAINKKSTQQVGYLDLGLIKEEQGLVDEAIFYLEKSLTFNAIRSTDPNVVITYEGLTRLYNNKGNSKKAFYFQTLLMNAKDSLFNQQVNEKLFSLGTEYETEKKELIIAAQQSEIDLFAKGNELKNQRFVFVSLILLIGFFIVYLWKSRQFSRKRAKLQKVFAQDLISNVEQERKRISSELHDSVGQQLILLKNQASLEGKKEMVETVGNTLEEVRAITRDLHPAILDNLGLKAALEEMIVKLDENTDVFFSTELCDIDQVFSDQEELNIYRIVQEGFNNVLKHANASSARLTMEKDQGNVRVILQDNGDGFSVDKKRNKNDSLGLKTMRERAAMLKAKFMITSDHSGTKVTLRIPQ